MLEHTDDICTVGPTQPGEGVEQAEVGLCGAARSETLAWHHLPDIIDSFEQFGQDGRLSDPYFASEEHSLALIGSSRT